MKAAIFNPYLDTVGGGERYSMSFAKVLKDHGYEVDVQWKNSSIQNKLEMRFGINLDGFNFVKDIKRGDGYDICFWVSDGSIPLLRARKNFLHFQSLWDFASAAWLRNRLVCPKTSPPLPQFQFSEGVAYRPRDLQELPKQSLMKLLGQLNHLRNSVKKRL